MILADKIITLRKKAGWSQEELASQLGVTRQSVSKWEGAQSVPDLDKVVQMSRLFGVSTDYLLKDELEEEEFVESEADETPLRRVTMEQAARYLALRKACAPKIALAVAMCIVSPVVIIFLSAMADAGLGGISEDLAAGLGVSVILVLVAIAVGMFLSCGAKTKEFDFLEKEPFETEYGVSGMVRERRKAYEPTASRCTILGVVLCILLFNTPTDTYITYAMNRILDTGIGVLAAIFVNGMLPGGFTFSFMHRLYQRLGIRDDVEDEFMAKPAV